MSQFIRLSNHVRNENTPSPMAFPACEAFGEDCTPEYLRRQLTFGKELQPPKGFRGPWVAWMHEVLGIDHADYPNKPMFVHRFMRRDDSVHVIVSWTEREASSSGQSNDVDVEHGCAAIRLSDAEFMAVCVELQR